MKLSSNPLYDLFIQVTRLCISFLAVQVKTLSFLGGGQGGVGHFSLMDLECCSVSFIVHKSPKIYLNGSLSHFIISIIWL